MENSPARQQIIDRMVEIARHDAPWMWGYHPKDYVLRHAWLHNSKPDKMTLNGVKYIRLDAAARDAARREWNAPVLWPLALALVALAGLAVGLRRVVRQRGEAR
jgi:hypothetical protein